MRILDFIFPKKSESAAVAKERLQIVLAHERVSRDGPDFLPMMQKELMQVVAKYLEVEDKMIKVNLDKSGGTSVLEINVEIDPGRVKARAKPEAATPAVGAAAVTAAPAKAEPA